MTHFVEAYERNGMITIDGYTTCKRMGNAIKDIAKVANQYAPGEGDCLIEYYKDGEPFVPNTSADAYCFEMEEVCCASTINEDTDEVEYAEGAWYFLLRVVAPLTTN